MAVMKKNCRPKIQQIAEDDADRRMISRSSVRRQVPVTRPRATPHADTTSIPAEQDSGIILVCDVLQC